MVRLEIRLDEGARVEALKASLLLTNAPGASPKDSVPVTSAGKQAALANIDNEIQTLAKQRPTISQAEYNTRKARLSAQRMAIQTSGTIDVETRPGALAGSDTDDLVVLGDIQPTFCRVTRNGLNDADTFEVEIDFKDAPFDPRIIRSAFVEIGMGIVPADQFALGVDGALFDGALASQLERPLDDSDFKRTRFYGFVDDWEADFEDGDTIKLSGRATESLLMTVDVFDTEGVNLKVPIVQGLRDFLNAHPETENMEVVFGNPNEAPKTDLGPTPAGSVARNRKGRKGKVVKRARVADRQRMKMWDHITEVVGSIGFVAIIRGLRLYVADPRTFLLGIGNPLQVVYGRNINKLNLNRKLGGTVKARTVEVRCYDPDVGKVRWARFPVAKGARSSGLLPDDQPEPTRANSVQISGLATDDVIVYRVHGINDQGVLERTAASVFEQLGRQEIEGTFGTSEVTSLNGREGDLLNAYPGDAIEILIASDDTVPEGQTGTATSNLQELQAQGEARRRDYLRGLGWSTELSAKMARAQRDVGDQQTVFRVAEVDLSYKAGEDGGFDVSVGFMNFLLARDEAGDAPPRAPGAGASALAGTASTEAAESLRSASAAQQTLGGQAEAGTISPDEFSSQGEASDQQAKSAAGNARRAL